MAVGFCLSSYIYAISYPLIFLFSLIYCPAHQTLNLSLAMGVILLICSVHNFFLHIILKPSVPACPRCCNFFAPTTFRNSHSFQIAFESGPSIFSLLCQWAMAVKAHRRVSFRESDGSGFWQHDPATLVCVLVTL